MACRRCRGIVLQFKDVLVVFGDSGVASSCGKGSLNRYRRGKVRSHLTVAHPAPLEMGFVDHTRTYHDRIADLNSVLLVVHIERLLGKIKLARTVRRRDRAIVGVANGKGVVLAQL